MAKNARGSKRGRQQARVVWREAWRETREGNRMWQDQAGVITDCGMTKRKMSIGR